MTPLGAGTQGAGKVHAMDLQSLTLEGTRDAIRDAILSGANLAIEGSPGIGKSAIVRSIVSEEMGLPFEAFFGSGSAPEDIGIPVKDDATRSVEIWVTGVLARLHKAGRGVLFIDEITDIPRAVWAPLQRLINEREDPSGRKLPDNVAIVMACNPDTISTGGQSLSLPVVGRITFVRMVPTPEEIARVFSDILANAGLLPAPVPNPNPIDLINARCGLDDHFRDLCAEFAGIVGVMPELIEMDPPVGDARPWGSPRSWDRSFRLLSAYLKRTGDRAFDHDSARGYLIGSVGPSVARSYLAIRKVIAGLPSRAEIVADPMGARLPAGDSVAAIAGVISAVARTDPHAGWAYADRLPPEGRIVSARALLRFGRGDAKSPNAQAGTRARIKLEAEIGKLKRAA